MVWTEYLYTAGKFVIGGGMIVGVTWLARYVDPRYGGILVAAPIITTIAFILTYVENGTVITQDLVWASFSFMIPTLIFVIALFLLMYRVSFVASLFGAYTIWIAGVLVCNRLLV